MKKRSVCGVVLATLLVLTGIACSSGGGDDGSVIPGATNNPLTWDQDDWDQADWQ